MDPINTATADFDTALAKQMESASTDVSAVQAACLSLLAVDPKVVSMCSEMCNSMGRTAAKVAAASKRVKAFNSLEERIDEVDTEIHSVYSQLNYVHTKIDECNADQVVLKGHRDQLEKLNG